MSRYLLDTNVVSSLMRRPSEGLLRRLKEVDENAIYTSIVVAAELRFGAASKGSRRLALEVEEMLDRIRVAPLGSPIDRVYGGLRADLERRGQPIGRNDLWIASQAVFDESVLVTDNVHEFGRVPRLKVENWLRA